MKSLHVKLLPDNFLNGLNQSKRESSAFKCPPTSNCPKIPLRRFIDVTYVSVLFYQMTVNVTSLCYFMISSQVALVLAVLRIYIDFTQTYC